MRNQRGVTIVEGLVALVILSVGMLGIASLYVASLKTGRTALLRTNAVNLVNDMLDSIRANGLARTAYRTAGRTEAPAVVEGCTTGGVCTREELAETDLATWLTAVTRDLPAGSGTVTVTPDTPADIYTVAISWREAGETADYNYRASIEVLPVRP
jgi:type IV pilus assembly protein PilV